MSFMLWSMLGGRAFKGFGWKMILLYFVMYFCDPLEFKRDMMSMLLVFLYVYVVQIVSYLANLTFTHKEQYKWFAFFMYLFRFFFHMVCLCLVKYKFYYGFDTVSILCILFFSFSTFSCDDKDRWTLRCEHHWDVKVHNDI